MLDKSMAKGAISSAPRLTIDETRGVGWADDAAMTTLRDWVESYLMHGHEQLGRTGAVCPFTRQAAKLDTIRLAISRADASEEDEAFTLIGRCFAELDAIPCKPGMEHFRTIIIGFPDCADQEGMKMLERVQRRHIYHALSRFRMIGYMVATSEARGLWNKDFRPLRSPLPVLAIRHLVEQDAPFAVRNPLLLVPYLIKFRLAGDRRPDLDREAKSRMDVAADLRQARSLIEDSLKRLHGLPEGDRPVDPARAVKTLNDAFLVLDAAIDEIEA